MSEVFSAVVTFVDETRVVLPPAKIALVIEATTPWDAYTEVYRQALQHQGRRGELFGARLLIAIEPWSDGGGAQ